MNTAAAATITPMLILGSKNYSSWSLRPWLFSRKVGFDFREHVIHFDAPDYRAQIAHWSPSLRVPLLVHDGVKIGDSLAICEYLADCTGRGMPSNRTVRALARSAAAEMHSGFQALREGCPMNVRARDRHVPATPELRADMARIDELWSQCRRAHAAQGAWLFGEFSIADAMFAPVIFRFQTYGAQLGDEARDYMEHVLRDPAMREWQDAALQEGHALTKVDCIGLA